MTRRLTATLLATTLVLAACGGDDGSDEGAGAPAPEPEEAVDTSACPVDALADADGPVRIEFWHAMAAANGEVLEAMTQEYNASQDAVEVELVFTGSYDETFERFRTAAGGGELPTIVQLEETRIQAMIDSEAVVPVQSCVEAAGYDTSDHLQPVLDQFTVGDVLWPMPFNASNPVLYYNGDDFTEAGLDPASPPQTLDEVLETARVITESGAAAQGMAIELQPGYVEQLFAKAGEPIVDGDNGREERATEARLADSPIGEEVYTWIDELIDGGYALNVGRNPSGADHLLAIAGGNAAMTIGTSAALGSVYDVLAGDPNLAAQVDVRVAPMPGPDDGGVVVGGGALWLVEAASDVERAAAWDYLAWLNEPQQQATWHAGTGYIPIRRSAAELPEVQQLWADRPGFKVAFDQITGSGYELGGPVIGGYDGFRDAIQLALEDMIASGTSPADAVAAADEAATEAIQDYNERNAGG